LEPFLKPTPEADAKSPSELLAIGEGFLMMPTGDLMSADIVARSWGYTPSSDGSLPDVKNAMRRHNAKLNSAFCDGHVEGLKVQALYFDTTDEALRRWNRDNNPHREILRAGNGQSPFAVSVRDGANGSPSTQP